MSKMPPLVPTYADFGRAKRTIGPVELPFDLDEMQMQLRLGGVEWRVHQSMVNDLCWAAVDMFESMTKLSVMSQTWEVAYDKFPEMIELRRHPVQSVTSVAYIDTEDAAQVMDPDDYTVALRPGFPGRIMQKNGWPGTATQLEAVTVTYVTGHATADAVPRHWVRAIKMLASHWYANTDAVLTGSVSKPIEFALEAVVEQYRSPTLS